MKEKLQEIKEQAMKRILEADNLDKLNDVRIAFLGKKGELTAVLKSMKNVDPKERPMVGQMVNEARESIEKFLDDTKKKLENKAREIQMEREVIDVTLPARKNPVGHRHPNAIAQEEVERIFIGMGYEVIEGPEIEYDEYNFEKLNIPANHPAKDEQDTFYITKDILLRTHTSSIQVRTMERQKPPIRVICPGRVFRNEAISYRAHCIFHQIEGLYIDEEVSFADLKQSLLYFAKELFGEQTAIRMRPSYFPFTEPSAEVDVSCNLCGGKGCPVCKGTGWLEILGCGMVDPNVLEACGIDSKKYSGFAFGMGIERVAMLKYGVGDLRLYFENDVRFLHQFDTALD